MNDCDSIGVLIVEDDSLVAEMIADVLEGSGYRVLGKAMDGGQALEMTLDIKPDVILLDLQLPVMSGLAVAARITQTLPTPIVVLTAYDSPEYVDEAARAGVGAFLVKPPNSRELDRAITVARARFSDVMELSRLNEQLALEAKERAKKESECRSIIQTTLDGFWMMDEQGRCIEVNQAFADILGYTVDELIGRSIQDIEAQESPEETARHIEEVMRNGSARFETRHRRKDNRLIDVEISTNYLADQNKYIVFCRDITERKKEQTLIHESEERLRAANEASLDSFLIFHCERDAEGEICDFIFVDANRRAEQTLQLKREDLIGRRMCEVLPINRTHGFFEKYKTVAETGTPLEEEFFLPETNVPAAWFYHQVVRLDRNRIAISNRNITHRKHLEKDLRHSEDLFRGIYENNPIGITLVDPATQKFLRANRTLLKMLEYTEEELRSLTVQEITHVEDRDRENEEISRRLKGKTNHYELDKRFVRRNGDVCWARVNGEVICGPDGNQLALATIVDLTESKRAAESLLQERQRLSFVIDGSGLGTWEWNIQTNKTVFNDAWAEMLGYTIADLTPYNYDTWARLVHPDDIEKAQREMQCCVDGIKKDYSCEFRMRSKTGEWVWILDRGRVMTFDEAGQPLAMFGTHTNIDSMKKAEEAVRESEQRHRDYIANTPYGVFVTDEKGRYLQVNPSACRITGYNEAELLAMSVSDMFPEEGAQDGLAHFRQVVQTGKAYEELKFRHKNGEVRWWLVSAVKLDDSRMLGFCNDITDRKQAEEEMLREREQMLSIFESIDQVIYITDPETYEILYINPAFKEVLKKDEGINGGTCYREFQGLDSPCSFCTNSIILEQAPKPYYWEYYNPKLDRHFSIVDRIIKWPDGRNVRFEMAIDVTDQKTAEKELHESEKRFLDVLYASRDAILLIDNNKFVDCNEATASMLGYKSRDEFLQTHPAELSPPVQQDGRESTEKADEMMRIAFEEGFHRFEWMHRRADGEDFPVEVSFTPVVYKGRNLLHCVWRDITAIKEAEREKANLSMQLQQAMKMDAIGRLAGGVAHDFNNILTGINGYAEMILEGLEPGDPMRADMEEIKSAGERAAGLTAQLLAFSRRQIISPKVVRPNDIIERSQKMIGRIIGEDINFQFKPTRKLGRIKADPAQLDQILVNLSVNARDAMPDGGKLVIETQNIHIDQKYCNSHVGANPGDHVMLAVTDTGCGMNEETQSMIFEPFFSTKGNDEGAGLGLATVYGIVQQNKGFITVDSEMDVGTTFKVYFPRVMEAADELPENKVTFLPKGTETVLLVEDEDMVRKLAKKILERQGYEVIEMENGGSAYAYFDEHDDPVDLLLTDVIMPNMNGKTLFDKLRKNRPDLKAIFMSGYTENAIAHHGVLDEDTHFIQKPFTIETLARLVRNVLDSEG